MTCRLVLVAFLVMGAGTAKAACTVSAAGVQFGSYDPTASGPTDAQGSVTLNCSLLPGLGLGPYSVALGAGMGGSIAARGMRSGAFIIPYQLYSDGARTVIWGDGTGGSSAVSSNSSVFILGGSLQLTVYGRIGAGIAAAPGTYSDTVVVTLNY